MKYVGVDWGYGKAQWCALAPGGEIAGEGQLPADRDGLARLRPGGTGSKWVCFALRVGSIRVAVPLTCVVDDSFDWAFLHTNALLRPDVRTLI